MARKAIEPCLGPGLAVRRVLVRARDVVLLKGILEASEGLAGVHAESGGDLWIAAPESRAAELDALLADLREEMPGLLLSP